MRQVVQTALLFGDGDDVLEGSKPRQDGRAGTKAEVWWDAICAELLPRDPAQALEEAQDQGAVRHAADEGVQGKEDGSRDVGAAAAASAAEDGAASVTGDGSEEVRGEKEEAEKAGDEKQADQAEGPPPVQQPVEEDEEEFFSGDEGEQS